MDILKNKFLKHQNGFTLAEVLITLVIIGIIAAMTIPTLIKNTKNQQYVAAFKKANSVVSQALISIAKNNDAAVGDYSFISNINFIDEMAKVTNVLKKCNTRADCLRNDYSYKGLNGQIYTPEMNKGLVTNDGMFFYFSPSGYPIYGLSEEDAAQSLGRIVIDTNGNKPPNKIGLDFFYLYIVNGKGIVPAGADDDSSCASNNHGAGCTARLLKENAITYL